MSLSAIALNSMKRSLHKRKPPTDPRSWRQIEHECNAYRSIALGAALDRNGWRVGATAIELEIQPSSVQRLISSLGLSAIYADKSPGRGRPRSKPGP